MISKRYNYPENSFSLPSLPDSGTSREEAKDQLKFLTEFRAGRSLLTVAEVFGSATRQVLFCTAPKDSLVRTISLFLLYFLLIVCQDVTNAHWSLRAGAMDTSAHERLKLAFRSGNVAMVEFALLGLKFPKNEYALLAEAYAKGVAMVRLLREKYGVIGNPAHAWREGDVETVHYLEATGVNFEPEAEYAPKDWRVYRWTY